MTDPRIPHEGTTHTLATGRDMLAAGTVLARRYRIVGVGGVGGMGIVYRAHDLQLGIDVALKLLHPDRVAGDAGMERFRREVLLSRRVSHPNVVRLHDIGEDGDLLFLTMDYVEANTLRERLEEGPLSTEDAVTIARQLADALSAAHAEGVVHRDLKPANVLVDGSGRAWLTDFGIARALGDDGMTRAGEIVGTLGYLAPEQVRGDAVTGATDVFALGLVLWEMLTGEVPLSGATRDETLARRAAARGAASLPGGERVPRWLRAVVQRCLAAEPQDRYQDAAVLSADLVRGSRSLDRRRWFTRGAVAAAVVTLAAALWFALPPDRGAPPATQHRLAVLPLVNATGDESLDWVQRALAEHVSLTFASNPALQPVDSVRVFRTLDDLRLPMDVVDERALRELTGLFSVGSLVRGRLLGSDDGLRLQFQVFTPTHERRYETDVTRATILAGAERLASEIVAGMRIVATPPAEGPRTSEVTAALAAFDEGVTNLARGDRAGAAAALERAVDADPEFGIAWLRLAGAHRDLGHYGRAVDAAHRAVELLGDGEGRHALWARATHAGLAGDTQRALGWMQRIVELYPQDADAAVAYGELLGDAGRFEEAIAHLAEVTELDPQHPRAWFLLGKFGILSGNARAAADDWLVRALVVQNRFGTDAGRAEVLNAMGIAKEQLGALDVATAHYREAARLRAAAGDARGEAGSLANLARLRLVAGDVESARTTLARALELRESIGDLPGVADLRNEFGVLEEEAGDYAAALGHYGEALRLRTEVGDVRGIAESYGNLAFAHLVHGQYDNADAFAARAIAAHDEAGSVDGRMHALLTLAQLRIRRGEWDVAQTAVLEALAISRRIGYPFGEASAEGLIGELSRHQGRASAALDAYARALEILESLNDTRGIAEYTLQRAQLWLDLNMLDAARADLAVASAALGEHGNLSQRAALARIEASVAAAAGEHTAATEAFDRAARLADSSGSAGVSLAVAVARASWLEPDPDALGDLARAAARLGDRPMRLQVLTRLAEVQVEAGDFDAATATLREALRPPVALDPWAGNWRLHWLASRTATATGEGDGAAALERARALLDLQWAGLPEAAREGMHALAIED